MKNTFIPIEILMDSRSSPDEVKRLTIIALKSEEYLTFDEVDLYNHCIEPCRRETKEPDGLVFKISNN
jgi:hypothetical protein